MKKIILIALSLVAMFALTGCSEENNPTSLVDADKVKPSERTTIVDLAGAVNAQTGEFSILIAALETADLLGALSGNGQLTVFAPTDKAFGDINLDEAAVRGMTKEELQPILLYHVAKGRRMAADVVASDKIRMLTGERTMISIRGEDAFINDSRIASVDNEADNGVIHIIEAVLLPSE